jgi:hypothetical protein
MPRSTRAARPRLVATLRAPAPTRLLTTARWLPHDEVFTQGTRFERPTFRARFQGWECTGDVGLSEAWRDEGATLGGRAEATLGEVAVVAGGDGVEGFSGCRLWR